MTKMHRLAKVPRSRGKRSFAVFKKVTRAHIKVGLVAAALFALAYAVETKAIFALESSRGPFEISADHDQNMYR
jgi:ABC-type Fe3+ transport system permease subunit